MAGHGKRLHEWFLFGRFRRMSREAPKNGRDQEKVGDQHPDDTLTIPPSVWISHVFNYLDRKSQNRLCVASKEIYEGVRILFTQQPWPEGMFRTKKVVFALAFSPTGDELAMVTSNSKSVSIWNRQKGFDQSLRGHKGQCSDVAYAPSNEYLATCSRGDGTLRLWQKRYPDDVNGGGDETNTMTQYWNYRILNVCVFDTLFVRISSNSRNIASFGNEGTIYLSNADDGTLTARTPWRSRLFINCYDCVAFPSLRHDILAHTFNNQSVQLWNWATHQSIELEDNDRVRMVDYEAYVTSIKFIVKGEAGGDVAGGEEYLAVGCRVGRVKIWSLIDYTCVQILSLGSGWSGVMHLFINKLGTHLACTGGGSQIRLFNICNEECTDRWSDHTGRVNTLAISPDGKTLASGGCDRTMRLRTIRI